MIIEFNVTQKHIDDGECEMAFECAVYLCIKEELCFGNFSTFRNIGMVLGDGKSASIKLPENIFEWIKEFDRYRKTESEPITFEVEIPDSVLEQIGYFDKKGTTTIDDYITKENNIEVRKLPKETKHQRHQMVEEESH